RVDMLREELVPAGVVATVVVSRDDEDVAPYAFAPRRFEPVGTTALDELDELIAVRRQVAPERFLLVGRIDGDRANRLRRGLRGRCDRASDACRERCCDIARCSGHDGRFAKLPGMSGR